MLKNGGTPILATLLYTKIHYSKGRVDRKNIKICLLTSFRQCSSEVMKCGEWRSYVKLKVYKHRRKDDVKLKRWCTNSIGKFKVHRKNISAPAKCYFYNKWHEKAGRINESLMKSKKGEKYYKKTIYRHENMTNTRKDVFIVIKP